MVHQIVLMIVLSFIEHVQWRYLRRDSFFKRLRLEWLRKAFSRRT